MSGMFGDLSFIKNPARHKSVEWYTPAWVFDELGLTFDLDPASPHDAETHVPAANKYTVFDNGLTKPWYGRVWLNPPYNRQTPFWMRRFIDNGDGVSLVFSRTDAWWCQQALKNATAILFVAGRIQFIPGRENQHKKSRTGAGSLFIAMGAKCADGLSNLSPHGFYLRLKDE